MVFDTVLQEEINKKEKKLYPVRHRTFRPNFAVKPLTGKFYARHDFTTGDLTDDPVFMPDVLPPRDRYKEPLTVNMEYGWYMPERVKRSRFHFDFPRRSTWITQIGAVIAMEEQRMPKKPFTGVAFKV